MARNTKRYNSHVVSVVMPVYNGEAYLAEAIDSVLAQDFQDFSLIIVDDASTDRSLELIQSYQDERIKIICNETNLGASMTVAKGIQASQGRYIIRMDQDDICLPNRFSKQVNFMDDHPDVAACGSAVNVFNQNLDYTVTYPLDHDTIKCHLLFECCLSNPSTIRRRNGLMNTGIDQRSLYRNAEDYALWVSLAKLSKLANLPDVLLRYRVHDKQLSVTHRMQQLESTLKIQYEQIRALRIQPTKQELRLHSYLWMGKSEKSMDFIDSVDAWLLKLQTTNRTVGYYPEPAFTLLLIKLFAKVCLGAVDKLGEWARQRFFLSPLYMEVRA